MKETDPHKGYNHRREWSLIILLLLLAVLLMFSVSQRALAMRPGWQVNADMVSLINPEGTIAAYIGDGQIEPVAPQILTPVSFSYLTPSYLTPVSPNTTITAAKAAIIHVSIPTETPTDTLEEQPTDLPIDTVQPTNTRTNTPTNTNTRVVIYYTPSFTPTNSHVPPSTATPTYTQSSTPSRTFTSTITPTQTRTSTPTLTLTSTQTRTPTDTLSPTTTYTRTNTFTPSLTQTRTNTFTPSLTPTHTNTFTPSLTPTHTNTFTYTITYTPSLTYTPTDTFTPNTPTDTPIPTTRCSNNKPEEINLGSPDGICTEVFDNRSPLDLNLGSNAITSDGTSDWDFIYYEVAEGAGIKMDVVILQISADGSNWHTVFNFGDGNPDTNSSIGTYGYAEADNTDISGGLIGGTGIGIDIDGLGLSGSYSWFRIISPGYWGGNRDQGCDVDAIETNP